MSLCVKRVCVHCKHGSVYCKHVCGPSACPWLASQITSLTVEAWSTSCSLVDFHATCIVLCATWSTASCPVHRSRSHTPAEALDLSHSPGHAHWLWCLTSLTSPGHAHRLWRLTSLISPGHAHPLWRSTSHQSRSCTPAVALDLSPVQVMHTSMAVDLSPVQVMHTGCSTWPIQVMHTSMAVDLSSVQVMHTGCDAWPLSPVQVMHTGCGTWPLSPVQVMHSGMAVDLSVHPVDNWEALWLYTLVLFSIWAVITVITGFFLLLLGVRTSESWTKNRLKLYS